MAKQHLLIVDSDPKSLRVLEVSLKKAGFSVTRASNGQDALEKIKISAPDMIISETVMPTMDGFELIQHLKKTPEWSDIPVMFLTAQKSIEDKIRGLEQGVEDYLTKPIFIREILARVSLIMQRRQRERLETRGSKTEFSGNLQDMGIVDLIQTIDISQKSGVITVTRPTDQGQIFFRNGKVIDAKTRSRQGEDAVYRMLVWSEGTFLIEFKPIEQEDRITLSTQGLLMEGMRRLDEWGRLQEQLPPLSAVFDVDEDLLSERLGEIPDEINALLKHFDGRRSLQSVLDLCPLGDLETLTIISKLYFEGLICETDETDTDMLAATDPPDTLPTAEYIPADDTEEDAIARDTRSFREEETEDPPDLVQQDTWNTTMHSDRDMLVPSHPGEDPLIPEPASSLPHADSVSNETLRMRKLDVVTLPEQPTPLHSQVPTSFVSALTRTYPTPAVHAAPSRPTATVNSEPQPPEDRSDTLSPSRIPETPGATTGDFATMLSYPATPPVSAPADTTQRASIPIVSPIILSASAQKTNARSDAPLESLVSGGESSAPSTSEDSPETPPVDPNRNLANARTAPQDALPDPVAEQATVPQETAVGRSNDERKPAPQEVTEESDTADSEGDDFDENFESHSPRSIWKIAIALLTVTAIATGAWLHFGKPGDELKTVATDPRPDRSHESTESATETPPDASVSKPQRDSGESEIPAADEPTEATDATDDPNDPAHSTTEDSAPEPPLPAADQVTRYDATLAQAKRTGNRTKKMELLLEAIDIHPAGEDALTEYAILTMENKRLQDQSLEFAQRAAAISPDNARAWLVIGWIHQQRGMESEAQEAYSRCANGRGSNEFIRNCKMLLR